MLSKRLKVVLDYIENDDIVADIGCDHGYLGIACIEKGIKFVQLIDNKEGPLSSAKANLKNYDSSKYELTLSDGLDLINNLVNTVVICGMGGELIVDIINNHLDIVKNMKKVIVQANTKINYLRKYLSEHSLKIVDESIVEDMDKIYEIIVFTYEECSEKLDDFDILFGPCLRKEKNTVFIKKWTERLNEYNRILSNSYVEEIKKEKEMIEEVLYGKSK